MKVIALASQKGGSGKSTLCAHLAVLASATSKALVIDLDPQGSLTTWWNLREEETPLLIQTTAAQLPEAIVTARDEGIDWVFVDLPPHQKSAISDAMRLADITLIPMRPGLFDLAAIEATADMAKALRRPAYVVLNATAPRLTGMEAASTRDARTAVTDLRLLAMPTAIVDRADYRNALISGAAVSEMAPLGKADLEMKSLWKNLMELTNG